MTRQTALPVLSTRIFNAAFVVSAGLAVLLATPAFAQTAASSVGPNGVAAAAIVETQARVVGIDTVTNSVALLGESGKVANVAVNPEVGNVSKLQIGDTVSIKYQNALLIRAAKVASNGIRERIDQTATMPASEGSTASVRRVEVLATVQKIDRVRRTITLRGPNKTETFHVGTDISLKQMKVGDSVEAEFQEATAILVTRNGAPIQ
jgi:hypothetical protein